MEIGNNPKKLENVCGHVRVLPLKSKRNFERDLKVHPYNKNGPQHISRKGLNVQFLFNSTISCSLVCEIDSGYLNVQVKLPAWPTRDPTVRSPWMCQRQRWGSEGAGGFKIWKWESTGTGMHSKERVIVLTRREWFHNTPKNNNGSPQVGWII